MFSPAIYASTYESHNVLRSPLAIARKPVLQWDADRALTDAPAVPLPNLNRSLRGRPPDGTDLLCVPVVREGTNGRASKYNVGGGGDVGGDRLQEETTNRRDQTGGALVDRAVCPLMATGRAPRDDRRT